MGLLIGLQSLWDKTLTDCGKRVNRPAEYIAAVDKRRRYGIGAKTSVSVGFDLGKYDTAMAKKHRAAPFYATVGN